MEKHIINVSYWLGMLSVVLAFLARAANILGPDSLHFFFPKGNPVGYHSFLDAAVLFFLTTIATASYRGASAQKQAEG